MNPISTDTHPNIEQTYTQLLTQAGPTHRLALALSLSQNTIEMSRSAIQKRYPNLSNHERTLKLIALTYGQDLAQRVNLYLQNSHTP